MGRIVVPSADALNPELSRRPLPPAPPDSAQLAATTAVPPTIPTRAPDAPTAKIEPTAAMLSQMSKLFRLLSDNTRLQIVYHLTQTSELHVRRLCELLGESQPAVSHHLALLRDNDLVEKRREGKHNFYSLKTRRITTLLDAIFAQLPEQERTVLLAGYRLSRD